MQNAGCKNLCVCVGDDIFPFLKWSLGQYSKDLHVIKVDKPDQLPRILNNGKTDILIMDCQASSFQPHQDLQKIKESNPSLNILLIIPPAINKEEALAIIKERLVKGMVVLPFSAEVICGYLGKLSSAGKA